MLSPIDQFRENLTRVKDLSGLHQTLSNMTTPIVDLSDLLRAQIVMIVSALDHYIQEITRIGMLEVFNGNRPQTDAFLRFPVALGSAMIGISDAKKDEWLDTQIREKHGHLLFQHPDHIANAIRRFSPVDLWNSVANELNLDVRDVKIQLCAIVDRRNRIVHEADLDPSYPGAGNRWTISHKDVTDSLQFIQNVCEAIHTITHQS